MQSAAGGRGIATKLCPTLVTPRTIASFIHGILQARILEWVAISFSRVYAEYIMWDAGLDEAQARIKIAGRIINNLRYADDTTLMVESREELKSLLMKVKEGTEKAGSKLNIQNQRSQHLVPSLHGK